VPRWRTGWGPPSIRLSDTILNRVGENLATQAMTNLAERGSLRVREHQSAFQLVFQDAVFGGQIFVSGQQLLVHRPCEVGQDARPIHNGLFAPISCDDDRPKKYTGMPPAPLCWPWITDRPISRFSFLTLRDSEEAIRSLIALIVLCCDPLAITMTATVRHGDQPSPDTAFRPQDLL
jgi:hypothetical protein